MAAQFPEHPVSEQYSETKYSEASTIDERTRALMRQLGVESLDGFSRAERPEVSPNQQLRSDLKRAIIGQDSAVDSIITALDSEPLRDPAKPYCSLLFLGPTGSGKTETVRTLDYLLHGEASKLTRIDCSDYQEDHQVLTITGAPPSYVGREQVSPLAPENIQGDFRIVLFDEIEKASPALFKIMLQILEEGQLRSQNTGKTSYFNNCLIILTSNLGAREMSEILEQKSTGFGARRAEAAGDMHGRINRAVSDAVKSAFPPEFINRIDQQVIFKPHSDEQLEQVVEQHIAKVNDRRFERQGIQLSLSEQLIKAMVQSDPERRIYNGRRIVKTVENRVFSRLSEYLAAGSIARGSRVYAVLDPNVTAEGAFEFEFYTSADDDLKERYEQYLKFRTALTVQPIESTAQDKAAFRRKVRSLFTGGGWVDWGREG